MIRCVSHNVLIHFQKFIYKNRKLNFFLLELKRAIFILLLDEWEDELLEFVSLSVPPKRQKTSIILEHRREEGAF